MTRFFSIAFILSTLSFGCAARQKFVDNCPGVASIDSARVAVPVDLKTVAGGAPFRLGAIQRAHSGVEYKVSKLRYYLSEATLFDLAGNSVKVALASADGKPLRYGVALVDYAAPESLKLSILAPPGDYRALNLTVGVPGACSTGEQLNHADASARLAPLDVDSDMYWSWNPNYIFLKVEGQASANGKTRSFFYHVGEDARRATLHLHLDLHVSAAQPSRAELIVDVNQLFVNKAGEDSPRLQAGDGVHGGSIADEVAANIAQSAFIVAAKPGAPHAAR